MVEGEAARYASGQIQSPTIFREDIAEFFAGPEPDAWFQRLASALLFWAYPALPLDASLLPRPLTPEDVPPLYEAIFAPRKESKALLGDYGPGLGLSKQRAPLDLDPEGCEVFRLIRAELGSSQGELHWKDIQLLLAHASGLTRPLATLYLLTFAYQRQPETELRLNPGHGLSLSDGRPVRGDRLTREFIPLLPWQDELFDEKIATLRLLGEQASWNDALQYTSLLCQGLTEIERDDPSPSGQEQELLEALRGFALDTYQAGEVLDNLSRTILSPDEEHLLSSLHRLSGVCEKEGFRNLYNHVRQVYDNPQELLQELDLVKRLLYLQRSLDDIVQIKSYLDGATIEGTYRQLSFERSTLLEEMSLPVLLDSGQVWPTVREHVQGFQTRYRQAYLRHHSDYHHDAAGLRASLECALLKVHALTLLNSTPELGQPPGPELSRRYDALEQEVQRCDTNLGDLDLHSDPRCPNCRIALGETPPAQELDGFARDLDHALGELNRRLSSVLVGRVLQGRVDQRMEDFLRIIQASDLLALSNTLNNELVSFIGEFLRNP